jgi:hypothetical protein
MSIKRLSLLIAHFPFIVIVLACGAEQVQPSRTIRKTDNSFDQAEVSKARAETDSPNSSSDAKPTSQTTTPASKASPSPAAVPPSMTIPAPTPTPSPSAAPNPNPAPLAVKIQDLDFELPITLNGANETMKQAVIIAYTIELAKIRNEYPDLYNRIKTGLRRITLTTSGGGLAGGGSITTTASGYRNGFTLNSWSVPIHEMGHIIHGNLSRTTLSSLNGTIENEYDKARSSGSGFITNYSRTNSHEFLAESVMSWFYQASSSSTKGHAALKSVNPAMYQLCAKLFYAPDSPEVVEYLARKQIPSAGSSFNLMAQIQE